MKRIFALLLLGGLAAILVASNLGCTKKPKSGTGPSNTSHLSALQVRDGVWFMTLHFDSSTTCLPAMVGRDSTDSVTVSGGLSNYECGFEVEGSKWSYDCTDTLTTLQSGVACTRNTHSVASGSNTDTTLVGHVAYTYSYPAGCTAGCFTGYTLSAVWVHAVGSSAPQAAALPTRRGDGFWPFDVTRASH